MDDVQEELQSKCPQLPQVLYHNNTRNIIFMVNDREEKIYKELELIEINDKSEQAKQLLIEFAIPDKYIDGIVSNMVEEKYDDPRDWKDFYKSDKIMEQLGIPKLQTNKFSRKYEAWLQ
eukprot:315046_1